ncbi:TetR/AcrR family transcriptional regulator [Clostridium sp. D2Q-11]|uniref:TetR/AcrR family transcriptional regulator n=1 Tax=Anaeromonas frigoriresistens TaxID=2683708 RepID=A0A942UZ21_9FIRM|nr:TetR/AcrR family transcriptional regulator [Anaeromonas frigoriresistens]MBS4537092.1 TetR/AcrR family transcriptional regulator [Anaeromonas frigoriresistens]
MTIKNQKEKDILEAAVKVFSRNGYHSSKMQEIADQASVGKGTLYEYFKGKSHLFEEMMVYCMDKYIDELKNGINKSKNIEDILMDIARFHGKFLKDHLDMVQTFMNNTTNISDDIRCKAFAHRELLINTITSYIEEAKESGSIRKDIDEKVCAMTLFGTLNQFYTNKIYIEKEEFQDIDPYPIVDIILNGIK